MIWQMQTQTVYPMTATSVLGLMTWQTQTVYPMAAMFVLGLMTQTMQTQTEFRPVATTVPTTRIRFRKTRTVTDSETHVTVPLS